MLNSQDSDDPSFDTYTPESVEVAVVETERSQLSDKIAVHLCLLRSSFLGLPVNFLAV